jgi:HAMP domain-containing protein
MKPSHRIRARLSLASLVFLALVLLLGGVSIGMIAYGNAASSDIRDRWLQNTRLIGDFENFTSDYRADEGSLLLSSTPDGINANRDDMAMLDRALGQSRDEFVRLPHDPAEASLYHRFETQWQQYKQAEGQVFASFKSGDLTNAVALYQTVSKLAYTQVSDTLETLRTTNIAEVMAASARSETTNRTVLWLIVLAVVITDALALLALLYIRRSTFNPLIDLIGSMQSLAHNDTDITIRGTLRTDEIGDLARAVLLFKQNIIALDGSRKTLEQQAVMLLEKIEEEHASTQFRVDGLARIPYAAQHHRWPCAAADPPQVGRRCQRDRNAHRRDPRRGVPHDPSDRHRARRQPADGRQDPALSAAE